MLKRLYKTAERAKKQDVKKVNCQKAKEKNYINTNININMKGYAEMSKFYVQ